MNFEQKNEAKYSLKFEISIDSIKVPIQCRWYNCFRNQVFSNKCIPKQSIPKRNQFLFMIPWCVLRNFITRIHCSGSKLTHFLIYSSTVDLQSIEFQLRNSTVSTIIICKQSFPKGNRSLFTSTLYVCFTKFAQSIESAAAG